MKKNLIILSLMMCFSTLALAGGNDSKLPSTLRCQVQTEKSGAWHLKITHLNTKTPSMNVDGSLIAFENNEDLLKLEYSNECDNYYTLVFFTDELKNLASGKTKEVKAMLKYFDADSVDTEIENTRFVVCK